MHAFASVLQRNNVKQIGNGTPPMLFAHGFGCDQNMWRYITPAFVDTHEIITFDYVGAGKSDPSAYDPIRYETLDGYARDILEIVDELDLHDVVFVGHSVSSMIGLLAAVSRPQRFSKMIMIGPSPCYINEDGYVGGFDRSDINDLLSMMDKNYMGWASAMAPAIMGNSDQPEFSGELEASFCSTDPVIAKQFAKATFLSDNRADLERLTIPTLLLQCSNDLIAPDAIGEYLHQNLLVNSLISLKATGHCPQLSHPNEVIRVMKDYLGE